MEYLQEVLVLLHDQSMYQLYNTRPYSNKEPYHDSTIIIVECFQGQISR